jgi:asparagine synthase (glutamine-hydrolysing)
MIHRGPDDSGIYVAHEAVLGHRRLSIIDLSTGNQPLSNEDHSIWTVYNGEIYNYKELQHELVGRGHTLRTASDTEVIVHLYEEYGEDCVLRLQGMFAFALWDERRKLLLLARDRVGIKPLYYCLTNESLLFASEIKALLADPFVKREVHPEGIDRFLTFYYMPGSETLLRDIYKLKPGHLLVLNKGKVRIRQYWDLNFPAKPRHGNFDSAVDELSDLLLDTVRRHMLSDVPVGILLSGGVDSSAMLSLAADETLERVSAFTIGFGGESFADERYFARIAAKCFGATHHEITITANDFREFLPKYVWHMEEPVCEPPAVALYYVTKLARERVKVLISGEGGDEAFAGYQNYRNIVWLERAKLVAGHGVDVIAFGLGNLSRVRGLGRLEKYSFMMKAPLKRYYYSRTAGPWNYFHRSRAKLYSDGFRRQIDASSSTRFLEEQFINVRDQSTLNQMLYVDTKTWLPDDLLIKADKITMANSLELRVPLLDHNVLEFAAGLSAGFKIRGFTTKYILKQALASRVPKEILKRKKAGFPVPVETWLANDLRDFIHDVLLDSRTISRGYFRRNAIEALLSSNSHESPYSAELFSLVTLELWHRTFIDRAT